MPVNYVDPGFIQKITLASYTPAFRSASGYGAKIPCPYLAHCSDGLVRRIYAICYSNASSHWIQVNKERRFIADADFNVSEDL